MKSPVIQKHFLRAIYLSLPFILIVSLIIKSLTSFSLQCIINPFTFLYANFTFSYIVIFISGTFHIFSKYSAFFNEKFIVYQFLSCILFMKSFLHLQFLNSIIITAIVTAFVHENNTVSYTKTKGLFPYLKQKNYNIEKTIYDFLQTLPKLIVFYFGYKIFISILFLKNSFMNILTFKQGSSILISVIFYFFYTNLLELIFFYNISLKMELTFPENLPEKQKRFVLFQLIKKSYEEKRTDTLLYYHFGAELQNLKNALGRLNDELNKLPNENVIKVPFYNRSTEKKIGFVNLLKRKKKLSENIEKEMERYFYVFEIVKEIIILSGFMRDKYFITGCNKNLIDFIVAKCKKIQEKFLIDLGYDIFKRIKM